MLIALPTGKLYLSKDTGPLIRKVFPGLPMRWRRCHTIAISSGTYCVYASPGKSFRVEEVVQNQKETIMELQFLIRNVKKYDNPLDLLVDETLQTLEMLEKPPREVMDRK